MKQELVKASALPADLGQAYNSYVTFLDASPRTVQTYTGNIKQFIKWMHQKGITQPQRQDIIDWRENLKTRCKPSTVQNYITALRLFFKWTEQAGLYPNIADHIKGAKLDSSHKKDYLNAAQVKDILDSIDTRTAKGKRDYCIIALMVTGGLRDIEISRANIEDLRQAGSCTVLYLQGKGREERTEYIKVVPAVEKPLREYLKTRRKAKGKQPLFASTSNNNKGERLTPKSISSIVKNHFINAGYNSDRLTAHSLRHTAVTLSLIGGLPLEEVQQFARHKNISTTQIYAHNLDRAKNRSEDTIAKSIF
jgi:integrase/recombinase XerC